VKRELRVEVSVRARPEADHVIDHFVNNTEDPTVLHRLVESTPVVSSCVEHLLKAATKREKSHRRKNQTPLHG
jgi:hypothetical protein